MRGRSRKTKKKTQQFIEVLRRSANVSCAARAIGIGRATAYRWRDDSPEFAELWEEAIHEAVDNLEAEAWRRAIEGTNKPVYHGGQLVGHIPHYSDTLLIFLLKGHRPERFKDRTQIQSEVKIVDTTPARERLRALLNSTPIPSHDEN